MALFKRILERFQPRLLAVGFLVVFLIFGLVQPASALSTGFGLSAAPNPNRPTGKQRMIYTIQLGGTVDDALLISNPTDTPMTIELQALDAINTSDGAVTVVGSPAENMDAGNWIKLEKTELQVAPHTQQTVKFTISVPSDTWVGDHSFGFGAFKSEPVVGTTNVGGNTAKISLRSAILGLIQIPGEKKWDVKFIGAKYASDSKRQLFLTFAFSNGGNVRADITGHAKIYGIFGYYDEADIGIGRLLPKRDFAKQIPWPGEKAPYIGPYVALATFNDIANPDVAHPIKVTLWMFFWPLLPTLIFLLILILFWLIYQFILYQRSLRLARARVVVYHVKSGDNLFGIAQSYGLAWKLLARINNLQPPYDLSAVKELYIPDVRGERRSIRVPNYFVQLARPFAVFGAWLLGRVFRIDRFRKVSGAKTRHSELVSESKLPAASRALPAPQWLTAIVEPGDTLRKIADYFKVDSKKIIKLNALKFPFKLEEGMELKIPKSDSEKKSSPKVRAKTPNRGKKNKK